jgi:TP901 family phage tail tape measure protein
MPVNKKEILDITGIIDIELNPQTLAKIRTNIKTALEYLETAPIKSDGFKKVNDFAHSMRNQLELAGRATRTLTQRFGEAFKRAFSLEKLLNRMAFVITAKLSYEIFDRIQQSIAGIVNETINWEEELSKVFTLLGGIEKRFESMLTENVKTLVKVYGQELEQSTRAVYDILSARFDPEDVEIISKESAELAIGEFTDIKIAVDAVTTVLNSFSLSAEHAGEAASFIAQMVTDGKTTLKELHTNLGKITSVAASLGFEMESLGAAFATGTLQGIKTDTMITSLRQLMMRLIDPSSEATKIVEKYGLQLDIASIQAGGFSKVLEEMNGLTEDELLAFAKSRRGAQALFAMINNGTKFHESYNNQLTLTDVHHQKYLDRMGTMTRLKEKLNGSISILAKNIGDNFLPTMKVTTQIFTWLIDVLSGLPFAILAIIPPLVLLGAKIRLIILEIKTTAVGAIATIKAALGSILLALDAVAFIIPQIFKYFGGLKEKASELMLEMSLNIFAVNKETRELLDTLNRKGSADAVKAYNEQFETTLITIEDINAEIEKRKKTEDILYINAKKIGELFGKESDIYKELLKSAFEETEIIKFLAALKGEYLTDEEATRKKIIRVQLDAQEIAENEYKLAKEKSDVSRQERYNLEELLGVYNKTLAVQKENKASAEAIFETEIKIKKTKEELLDLNLKIAKEEIDVAEAGLELQKLRGISAEEYKERTDLILANMKAEVELMDIGSAKMQARVELERKRLEYRIAYLALEDRSIGISDADFMLFKERLKFLAEQGTDLELTQLVLDLGRIGQFNPEQIEELLKLITDIDIVVADTTAFEDFVNNIQTHITTAIGNIASAWNILTDMAIERSQAQLQNRLDNLSEQESAEIAYAERIGLGTDVIREKFQKRKEAAEKKAQKREAELKKKQKPIMIAESIANTALAVTQTLASGIADPFVKIALAATVGVLGAIRTAQIAAQKFAKGGIAWAGGGMRNLGKAAKGMMIGGKSHAAGGTQFVGSDGSRFEAERNEMMVILNKRSTDMLRGLSEWNTFGGGIPLMANGGLINAGAGIPVPSVINGSGGDNIGLMAEAIANLGNAILDMEFQLNINNRQAGKLTNAGNDFNEKTNL